MNTTFSETVTKRDSYDTPSRWTHSGCVINRGPALNDVPTGGILGITYEGSKKSFWTPSLVYLGQLYRDLTQDDSAPISLTPATPEEVAWLVTWLETHM